MLTSAQFEARENEVFAALRVLRKHDIDPGTVTIEDPNSYTILSSSKNSTRRFTVETADKPENYVLSVEFSSCSQRITVSENLSIQYRASAPAAFPFIYPQGKDEYRERATIDHTRQKIIQENLHKYGGYAPDYINYGSRLLVFAETAQFDIVLAQLLEHIDELGLHDHVMIVGRRTSGKAPEQLWPK